MKQLALIAAFCPCLAFCIAGAIELCSESTATKKLQSLMPIALGIVVFVLFWHPFGLTEVTPNASVTLSRVMTMFSAVVASSGVFIKNSRRSSSILIAIGGLLMVFLWMFLGQVLT